MTIEEGDDDIEEKRGRGRPNDARNARGTAHPAGKVTESRISKEVLEEVVRKAIKEALQNRKG